MSCECKDIIRKKEADKLDLEISALKLDKWVKIADITIKAFALVLAVLEISKFKIGG